MDFSKGLQKIVDIMDAEGISYMIVGGFAMSYYNRFRFTADFKIWATRLNLNRYGLF